MCVWAANFIVVKTVIAILPPVGFAFVRFGLAGLVLLGVTLAREGSVRIARRDFLRIAALGGLGFGVYQVLWTTALQHTTAGNSSLIVASAPVFTMLIASAIGADTASRTKVLGGLLSFTGVAIIIGAGAGFSLAEGLVGDLMTLGSAVLWAIYLAFMAPYLERYSPLRTTAWAILSGTVILLPIGLLQFASADLGQVTLLTLLGLAYSSLGAAGIANVVVFRAVKLIGPTRSANLQFLVPALAVVFAAIFLHEPIQLGQVVGGLAIVAGIVVARRQTSLPATELLESA